MNKNFQEILADNSEVILDSLLNNELLKEIPVLGTSLKLIRGIQNIRDQFYLKKIKYFIEYIGEIDDHKKNRLIDQSRTSEESRAKFGDALFTTIEQSDSEVKIEYVAIAFEAFLNDDINESDLREICHVIKISFADDLLNVVESSTITIDLKKVVHSGLAISKYKPINVSTTIIEPEYYLSESSIILRNAWNKYKST